MEELNKIGLFNGDSFNRGHSELDDFESERQKANKSRQIRLWFHPVQDDSIVYVYSIYECLK